MSKTSLKLHDLLLTSRPFWWITTAVPFLVGCFTQELTWSTNALVGFLYFAFPYGLFLYGINDIFDYESDIRNPRKSGIEGAVLAKEKHRPLFTWILLTNLPFLMYFLAVGNVRSNLWLGLIVFMCVAYSVKYLRFKEIPFLDSLTSAFHYTSPFLFGAFLSGSNNLWLPAFAAFYIWSMANHAFGAIQDIKPDREAGLQSIATQLGAVNTTRFCFILYTVAALLPALAYGQRGAGVSILLIPYVLMTTQTLFLKVNDGNPLFHHRWKLLTYGNYAIGALVSIYLIALTVN